MRASIVLALFSLIGAGCSANSHQSPIVGTWVLNPARTEPADVAKAQGYSHTESITFFTDGTYKSSIDFSGQIYEESGDWLVEGKEIYLRSPGYGLPTKQVHQLTRCANDLVESTFFTREILVFERRVK